MDTRRTVVDLIKVIHAAAYAALKFKPGQSLAQIEDEYRGKLTRIMGDYASADRPVTAFRNEMRRAANDAMNMAALAGWVDGGASGPIPEQLQDIVNARIDAEIGFIDELFKKLKELKQQGGDELDNFIAQRADGYTASLIGVYAQGKIIAGSERSGQWVYGATEEHCDTCRMLASDSPHPLSWFADNDYIPQQRGSNTLECGGWNCDCSIVDPETGEQLVP